MTVANLDIRSLLIGNGVKIGFRYRGLKSSFNAIGFFDNDVINSSKHAVQGFKLFMAVRLLTQ